MSPPAVAARGAYLLLGDVDWLVQDEPRDRLVAGGHRRRAVVCHVVVRVGKQPADRQAFHFHFFTWKKIV